MWFRHVVDDAMESDIPREWFPIDGVTTEDIPLHPEQPPCSKDCPIDITEADRGDFEIDTDPFPNTLEDDGVPVYPWTKRGKLQRCHIDFDRSDSEEVSGLHNMFIV